MTQWLDAILLRRRRAWTTRLTVDEATGALRDRTRTDGRLVSRVSAWWDGVGHRHWRGTIGESSFAIERVSHRGNPFRPFVRGRLVERDGAVEVQVDIRARVVPWLLVLAPLAVSLGLAVTLREPAALSLAVVTPLLWLIGQLAFRLELGATERALREDLPPPTAGRDAG